jgi:GAF domain-containing protein
MSDTRGSGDQSLEEASLSASSDRAPLHPGDDYARRLRTALGTSYAILSIFVDDRQLFIGTDGLPDRFRGCRELPAIEGFCKYVHDHGCQLILDDVHEDHGVSLHPLVGELGIGAYAGWHVTGESGRPVGVLAVLEDHARVWTSGELLTLMELAHASGPMVRAAAARARHAA